MTSSYGRLVCRCTETANIIDCRETHNGIHVQYRGWWVCLAHQTTKYLKKTDRRTLRGVSEHRSTIGGFKEYVS